MRAIYFKGAVECQVNDEGLFGDAEGARNEGARSFVVSFSYQASVDAGTTTQDLNNVVIPAMDKAITNAILSDFFDCGRRRRFLQFGATVDAISSAPIDIFLRSGCK